MKLTTGCLSKNRRPVVTVDQVELVHKYVELNPNKLIRQVRMELQIPHMQQCMFFH